MKRLLPAYPLFLNDPQYSLWLSDDELNTKNVETWYGEQKRIYGVLRAKGESWCFMGNYADIAMENVYKAEQISLDVTAFSTDFVFKCGKTLLSLKFVSPLLPNDYELLSMPVCYVEYKITGADDAEIAFFVNGEICYDKNLSGNKKLRGGNVPLSNLESAFCGLLYQHPLCTAGDLCGTDSGYYYITGKRAAYCDDLAMISYIQHGDATLAIGKETVERYLASVNTEAEGIVQLAYDDTVSINYYGNYLKGFYLSNHSIFEAMEFTAKNYKNIDVKLDKTDKELSEKAAKFGEDYVFLLKASFRQAMAAHKLVVDDKDGVLWLSKECGSGGFIATADVSYPSMPMFIYYNPELIKGMMKPILRFAKSSVWHYDFAPHDAGMYPVCSGQLYGQKAENNCGEQRVREGGFWKEFGAVYPIYDLPKGYDCYYYEKQMPIEESANMLLMFYAAYYKDKDLSFFLGYSDLCEKWADYLSEKGLKPENQLCTDDFAGHIANNLNLSIKATVALKAYSELLRAAGVKDYARYAETAAKFAKKISDFAEGKSHLPSTWDNGDETFSLKYNFVLDKLFGFGLFDKKIMEREVSYYLTKTNEYGIPLENRETFTKSDWLIWSAFLTDDIEKSKAIVSPIRKFLQCGVDRVPFSDLYYTETGKASAFRARSVQGGLFLLLLAK